MNSRAKGKRGELEWAKTLGILFGLKARRGAQFHGGVDSPDVVGSWPGTHPEVKRVEDLDLFAALEQAVKDGGAKLPYVAHRVNNKPWAVTILATDLARFIEIVLNKEKKGVENGKAIL